MSAARSTTMAVLIAVALVAGTLHLKQATPHPTNGDAACANAHTFGSLDEATKTADTACTIQAHNQGLTTVPPQIGNLHAVRNLNLSHNSLAQLPPEMGWLKELRVLDVSYNSLATVPGQVGWFRKMTTINLSHNELTKLPAEIGWWGEVRDVDLSYNHLATLPAVVHQWTKLEKINLAHNDFSPTELDKIKGWLPATTTIITE